MPGYINPFNEIRALHTLSTHMDQAKGSDKIAVFGIGFIAGLAAAAAGVCSLGVGATPVFRWVVHQWYTLEGENEELLEEQPSQLSVPSTDISAERGYPCKQLTFEQSPNVEVTVRSQDIFASGAVAIVNAANPHLRLEGNTGINDAIILQGGETYRTAHDALRLKHNGRFPRGEAALLPSGDLAAQGIQHVIVVAGPDMKSGLRTRSITEEDRVALYNCYYNSLACAHAQGLTSIAFPAIGTGSYKFNCKEAARISQQAIGQFLTDHPDTSITTISIHGFKKSFNAY